MERIERISGGFFRGVFFGFRIAVEFLIFVLCEVLLMAWMPEPFASMPFQFTLVQIAAWGILVIWDEIDAGTERVYAWIAAYLVVWLLLSAQWPQ